MANVKLVFCGSEDCGATSNELQMYVNTQGLLYVQIQDTDSDQPIQYTVFDKFTAVKLVKELKRQISLMD